MRHPPARLAVLLATGALAACDDHGVRGDGIAVRDSAGVQIVTIQPPDPSVPRWTAASPPTVTIGAADGSVDELLHNVYAALRTSDGSYVVANAGSFELRRFDAEGSYRRSIGREGDGPGEFRFPRYLASLPGDSVLAFDRSNQRISLFDPEGGFVTSWSARVAGAPPIQNAVGVAVGGVVLRGFIGDDPDTPGRYIAPEVLGVFDRIGNAYRTIDTIGGPEAAQVDRDGRLRAAMVPFALKSDVAAAGDLVFALDTEAEGSLNIYDHSGALVRILRFASERLAISPAMVSDWIESFFDVNDFQFEQVEEAWRAGFEQVEVPDRIPLFRSLVATDVGAVCAERYGPLESTPPVYWCFTPEGHWTRIVAIPAGLKRTGFPHQDPQVRIGMDYVLGVWKDELGVESVREYELRAAR